MLEKVRHTTGKVVDTKGLSIQSALIRRKY